ncbi:unnamed protein product [Closterium sp. NIES-65]|nr:unnamed protein product [Closterium sp. NIES-65]
MLQLRRCLRRPRLFLRRGKTRLLRNRLCARHVESRTSPTATTSLDSAPTSLRTTLHCAVPVHDPNFRSWQGYHDEEYKRRRAHIADIAKLHQVGTPIPRVQYSDAETAVWRAVLTALQELYPTHACSTFLRALPLFAFSPHAIPQLEDVSAVLHAHSGWRIRPVAGLLHPRDFLNGLAFKYFHSTQYIRHASQPMYTPEPDVCHELLGHVPMLADPAFSALAHAIGQASLGASDKDIWHLTKLYWYTVEFGTVMEHGEVRAFGAGLLSSYGELAYMRAGANGKYPSFAPLDPLGPLPRMSYKDGFQRTYFLCHGFHDLASKLHSCAALMAARREGPGPGAH